MDWATQLDTGYPGQDPELLEQGATAREIADEGRYGASLEILWNRLIAARRAGNLAEQAYLYIHMGRVYRNWKWNLAQKFYEDGLEAARCGGFTIAELVACCSLGELFQDWGSPDKALRMFEQSLALAESWGDGAIQQQVLLEMAECCRKKGERAREAALQAQARAIRQEEHRATRARSSEAEATGEPA